MSGIGIGIGIGVKRKHRFLLDQIINAVAAYSLQKIKSTSTKCIRVRRSSDNAELDIGFTGNTLDTSSLLTFVGSGNGYVVKWYDQSGNSNDVIQTAAANQPLIVSNGTLIDSGQSINWTNGAFFNIADSDDLSFGNGTTDSPFSLIALVNHNSLTNNQLITKLQTETGYREYLFAINSGILRHIIYNPAGEYPSIGRKYNTSIVGDVGTWHTYMSTYNGNKTASGIKLYRDGIRVDDTDDNNGSYTGMNNTEAKVANYYTAAGIKQDIGDYKAKFLAVFAKELSTGEINYINSRIGE
jgi:hypothetical protein